VPVTIEPGESLRSRLVLVNEGDGGVVVDLETGSFHRANSSAWLICEALARGEDRRTLERTLERTYGLSPAAAARDVAALLASLERVESPKRERLVAFESLASGGFLLLSRGIPVLLLRAEGRSLANVGDPPCPLAAAVRWAVPHLLALRGIPVLHASAVALGGGVQAFSGGTGAGKTF